MTHFIDKARKLEFALAARIEGASRRAGSGSPRAPLEIVLAAVEAVDQMVQPAGRGDRTFPFTHVEIRFAAASPLARAHLEAVCEGPPSVRDRIIDRLEASGCTVKTPAVTVTFADIAQQNWSHAE